MRLRLPLLLLLVPCLLLAVFLTRPLGSSAIADEQMVQAASAHDIQRFTLVTDLLAREQAQEQAQVRRTQAEAARFEVQAQVERERQEAEEARRAAEEAHAAWHREQDRIAAERAAQAASASVPPPGSNYGRFEAIAQCESNGRWDLNTGNGYFGGLQFLASTWRSAGGTRYAPLPHQATKDQQIRIAEEWLARTSWAQWPACSSKLGYR